MKVPKYEKSTRSYEFKKRMYLQGVFQCVIKFHDCCLVSTTITIVWCAEDGHYSAVVAPIVSLDQEITCMLPYFKFSYKQNYFQQIHKVKVPPSPAGGLLKPKLGRLRGWRSQKCPARRCNQHHGGRCPSHHGHLGPTITSHTLDPETRRKHPCCLVYGTC